MGITFQLMPGVDSLEKTLILGKTEDRRTRGLTEDEMVGWHHRLNAHEFEQAPGDGEGQGSLVCCSPWGCKQLDTTERLNNNNISVFQDEKVIEFCCMAITI